MGVEGPGSLNNSTNSTSNPLNPAYPKDKTSEVANNALRHSANENLRLSNKVAKSSLSISQKISDFFKKSKQTPAESTNEVQISRISQNREEHTAKIEQVMSQVKLDLRDIEELNKPGHLDLDRDEAIKLAENNLENAKNLKEELGKKNISLLENDQNLISSLKLKVTAHKNKKMVRDSVDALARLTDKKSIPSLSDSNFVKHVSATIKNCEKALHEAQELQEEKIALSESHKQSIKMLDNKLSIVKEQYGDAIKAENKKNEAIPPDEPSV